mmetsp:Transcript_11877/g.23016  ORF Transcript_11877/g.23016 Transcript_11877/m.23016 type:complete len:206 (+) Transcript_11877:54-671(+)
MVALTFLFAILVPHVLGFETTKPISPQTSDVAPPKAGNAACATGATGLLQVRSSVAKNAVPFMQDEKSLTKLQHQEDVGEQAPNKDRQTGIHEGATSAPHRSGAAPQEMKVGVPVLLQRFLLYRRSMTRFLSLGDLGTVALISLATGLVMLLAYRCYTSRPRNSYQYNPYNQRQDNYGVNGQWEDGAFLGPGGGYHRRERQQPCC